MARLYAWGVAPAMVLATLIGTPATAQTNLVQNPSFEMPGGSTGPSNANCGCTGSFLFWNVENASNNSTLVPSRVVAGGRLGVAGTNRAELGSSTASGFQGINQTLNIAPGNYTFSFYYRGVGTTGADNLFRASFGNTVVFNDTAADNNGGNYFFVSTPVTATGATTISFQASNDAGLIALDDISLVAAVPEPGTWMLMIAGFGLIGAALRRRQYAGVRRHAPALA